MMSFLATVFAFTARFLVAAFFFAVFFLGVVRFFARLFLAIFFSGVGFLPAVLFDVARFFLICLFLVAILAVYHRNIGHVIELAASHERIPRFARVYRIRFNSASEQR